MTDSSSAFGIRSSHLSYIDRWDEDLGGRARYRHQIDGATCPFGAISPETVLLSHNCTRWRTLLKFVIARKLQMSDTPTKIRPQTNATVHRSENRGQNDGIHSLAC